jgi:hypothetical protein
MAFKRVNKVIIGNDFAAALDLTDPILLQAPLAADVLQEGEVVVLNDQKQPLGAGTYATSPVIYIGVGTANTFVDPETGDTHREVETSDPIDGRFVQIYQETPFVATVQQSATIDFGTLVPEIGEEYAIKIVYKDLYEHPANYSHTYRVTAATAVLADLVNAFVARIQADAKRRVNAANVAGDLVVTALAKPLNDIDEYSQVTFEVALSSDNYSNDTAVTITPAVFGSGNPAQVRDAEKAALSHKGIINRISFLTKVPALKTDMSENYDLITVVYNRGYISADNQYPKEALMLTQVYLPDGSFNRASVLTPLNAWMGSLPRPFAAIV